MYKAKYIVKARRVLHDRLSAKDPDGRFCHYMKTCETEDVYMNVTKKILECKPFGLEKFNLANRVLLLDQFSNCKSSCINELAEWMAGCS
jgi:hypothetical protein